MGRLKIPIKVSNWLDVEKVALRERSEPPRWVEVDALVEKRAVRFYLQRSFIRRLGLRPIRKVTARTMADTNVERDVYSPVDLQIQGRSATFEVVEIPDSLPNVVDQSPLEQLYWVVDPRNGRLIPNPEHRHGELCDDF